MSFLNFLLKFKQFLSISAFGLLSNKLRSFLTMLGIIIGVAAVIIIMSVGAGAQSLIFAQVKSLGTNIIGILPGKSEKNSPPSSAMGIVITTLTYKDAMALKNKKNIPNLVNVVAYSKGVAPISWKNQSVNTNVSGVSDGFMDVEGGELKEGRFLNKAEEKGLGRVVILGSDIKKELFGDSEALGKKIKIKRLSFEVIGVMKERGTVAFQDYDNQVFIPVSTMQKLILGVKHIGLIRAKVDKQENIDIAISDIQRVLRERHNITDKSGDQDDFTVRSSAQALEIITVITDSLNFFLAAMAMLSLIVGGIGIMNTMLISVNERTREIGLRKAIGANNFNILNQFLIESVFLTLVGGIIGIIVGIIVSYLISFGANLLGYNWDFIISFYSIIAGILIAVLVGLIFGIYPAKKAAGLSPIEALRYE
ncbi:MAG: FtsX-like permease family protein [Xanthomonadaceae bacterium]|nr:FtsX-like permease family protein [Rhodospirillaceae bacterium]NIA17806.1 FtsX-like permease family protein [Xanthomonadaceae bacterium]